MDLTRLCCCDVGPVFAVFDLLPVQHICGAAVTVTNTFINCCCCSWNWVLSLFADGDGAAVANLNVTC